MRLRNRTLATLLLFAGLGILRMEAQGERNPADKYRDAYRQYLSATCPIPQDGIRHFVYFSRDREWIVDHPFLQNARFAGAQIMYAWRELESEPGEYDFSIIAADLAYLEKHGKRLFIQLQDVTFSPRYKAVPDYLLTAAYDGGVVPQYTYEGEPGGWVAKRWNEAVRARFALLLQRLGAEFDGRIEGINLQETAIDIDAEADSSFTKQRYLTGLKANMLALKQAFPTTTTMIYANFFPGEWLPGNDQGYLRALYRYGEAIGVGLGGPDLMVRRRGQLNHLITLMHEGDYTVPLGVAIQDGNYTETTGADSDYSEPADGDATTRSSIVPLLHAFAADFLRVDYMFWVDQKPYFGTEVLPCFSKE